MEAFLVDVFTTAAGHGNPAAVVLTDGLSAAEMGGIAARLRRETTFVTGTTLRFYQPSGAAMTLCGHGTLAALAVMGRQGRFEISVPAGDLHVNVAQTMLGMAMPPASLGEPMDGAPAAEALGIDVSDIDGPVQVAGVGRPKLIVPLASLSVLDGLHPDQAAVEEFCATVGVTGLYPFTRKARNPVTVADARHFCAGAGIHEDPVTGVAAVALAWYLWRHGVIPGCVPVKVSQGHAMGRPGLAMVRQEEDGQTWIYGQAVIGGTSQL